MEVCLCVPHKTDISALEAEYPDIYGDEEDEEGDRYFVGRGSGDELEDDDGNKFEWMEHDEAVAFCGFAEGLIPGASTLIEGNGGWAQGMISRRDFSSLAATPGCKREWKRISNLYWENHARGKAASKLNKEAQEREASPGA